MSAYRRTDVLGVFMAWRREKNTPLTCANLISSCIIQCLHLRWIGNSQHRAILQKKERISLYNCALIWTTSLPILTSDALFTPPRHFLWNTAFIFSFNFSPETFHCHRVELQGFQRTDVSPPTFFVAVLVSFFEDWVVMGGMGVIWFD